MERSRPRPHALRAFEAAARRRNVTRAALELRDTQAAIGPAAAANGLGVALPPARLFEHDLASGRLAQPFSLCVDAGRYGLTRLRSRPEMTAVTDWLQGGG